MAVLPPPGKTGKRRPAMKGVLMQDVSNGVERNRAWPRKRGRPKSAKTREQNEWFRQAQAAFKYMDPRLQIQFTQAVAGTPLLPRDLFTMMVGGRLGTIFLKDGGEYYPVQSKNDVSKSLDAISQIEGQTLIRTEDGWEGQFPETGGGWSLIEQVTVTAPTAAVEVTDIPICSEILVLIRLMALSAISERIVRVSTNNGASYFDTSGDYRSVSPDGIETDRSNAGGIFGPASAGRSGWVTIQAPALATVPKLCLTGTTDDSRLFLADLTNPIDAVQIRGTGSENITSGQFWVLAR